MARRESLTKPQMIKCLYRLATCFCEMVGKTEDAIDVLKDLLEVDPDNAAAKQLLNKKNQEWNKAKKKNAGVMKKMFAQYDEECEQLEKENREK